MYKTTRNSGDDRGVMADRQRGNRKQTVSDARSILGARIIAGEYERQLAMRGINLESV
jgi:hypothetical protein